MSRLTIRSFGSWGASLYGGVKPTAINTKLAHLPRAPHERTKPQLEYMKWPGIVASLGPKYFYRQGTHNEQRFYQMKTDTEHTCFVGSVNKEQLQTKTIENKLFSHTRGFAAQIILEGRGAKASFVPEYPNLHVRLGVGMKPLDLTRVVSRYPGEVKSFVDQKGSVIVVHGYDKRKVGKVAYRIFRNTKANPYTMKGAHIAFEPIKKKVSKKQ